MRVQEEVEEDEEGGGGGGGVSVAGRRLWIRRHSWQIRTWLQLCRKLRGGAGGATRVAVGGGGGGGVLAVALAPSGSSRSLCGPGPKSGPPATPPPPPSPASPPVSGPAPLYSLPLLRRISRTRRMGRGAARARRDG